MDSNGTAALLDRVRPVAERLALHGHRSYIVGGLVRDLRLGRMSSPDIDITTDATPDVVKAALAEVADDMWLQGERFGTIGLRIGSDQFEITTHRSDEYEPGSRKPSVRFSTAIEADLSRRDFTVNAIAMEIPSGAIIDPFGGAADLDAGVLRTPESPERSFGDDPLRMLRAARFHAGHHLAPTSELEQAMSELGDRVAIVSHERVRDETEKLLAVPSPGAGVRLLGRTGVLEHIVPGYDTDVSAEVADLIDSVHAEELVRRTAFYLIYTQRHGIEGLGRYLHARRYSAKVRGRTVTVLSAVLRGLDRASFGGDDFTTRVFLADADDVVSEAIELMSLERLVGQAAVARFEERRRELALREPLDELGPGLSGDEVMETLGIERGPAVGAALDHLRSIRLAEGSFDTAELRARLLSWWSGHGDATPDGQR